MVAAVAIGVWWFWGRGRPSLASGSCRGCNVLLITIDTLRSDRVGAFGSTKGLTPNIDRLAAEGVRLTRAYASAPLTLPSHTSILTAVSPPVHGIRANGLFRLGPQLPTIATVLKSAGYRTGAFVGSFVLDARFGLGRGFDVYDDRYGEKHAGDPTEGAERRAEDVIKPALAWILRGEAPGTTPPGTTAPSTTAPSTTAPSTTAPSTQHPFLAWIHLYDPHEPYRAPEPYASRYEPYDAEVAYTDAMVGRLLDELRAAGQLDRTLVMIAADHGESLGEHGERTHGVFTYDVTLRVPWIIWAGSRASAGSSNVLARLIDLAPTTLDLVGVDAPAGFEGRSLTAAIAGRGGAPQTAYFEAMDANLTRNWAPLTGVISGSDKLIELPRPELYDLDRDPKEATNLFAVQPDLARTLGVLLRETAGAFAARAASPEKTTLSADARQRLQALGYVAASADRGQRVYTDADDPKTLIGPANDLQRAIVAFNAGDRTAMATVRTIAQQHPTFATAYGTLAAMQRDTGDLAGAIATLEDLARRGLADQSVLVLLAGYLTEAGTLEKAAALLEAVVADHPDYAEAYNSLGVVNMRMGRHDRARAALRKVLELDPTSAKAYENLGADELAARDLAAAVPDLQRAVDLDPQLWDALYNLGLALDALGRKAEARPHLERFAREAPRPRYAREVQEIERLLGRS